MGSPEDYELGELIGKGAFSQVYKLIRKEDGKVFAVKQIDLYKSDGSEIKFLQTISSPFVVSYVESFKDQHSLYIVMEYCEHGNLREFIKNTKERGLRISEQKAWQFLASATKGLQTLHSSGIIHRDLKPENFFLDKQFNAKIGDLGVARALQEDDEQVMTHAGTPLYFSPEIHSLKKYSYPTDIYSLGVCFLELVTLQQLNPFLKYSSSAVNSTSGTRPYNDVLKACIRNVPSEYSQDVRDILFEMLELEPTKRITADQILTRPRVQDQLAQLKLGDSAEAPNTSDTGTIIPTLYDATKSINGKSFITGMSPAAPSSSGASLFRQRTTSGRSSDAGGSSAPFFNRMQSGVSRYTGADIPRIHAVLKQHEYPPALGTLSPTLDDYEGPDPVVPVAEVQAACDNQRKQISGELATLASALAQANDKQVKQLLDEGFFETVTRFVKPMNSNLVEFINPSAMEQPMLKDADAKTRQEDVMKGLVLAPPEPLFVNLICMCAVSIWNYRVPFPSPFDPAWEADPDPYSPANVLSHFIDELIGIIYTASPQTSNYILTAIHRYLQQALPRRIDDVTVEVRQRVFNFCKKVLRRITPHLDSESGEVADRAVKMIFLICIRTLSVPSHNHHPLFYNMNTLHTINETDPYTVDDALDEEESLYLKAGVSDPESITDLSTLSDLSPKEIQTLTESKPLGRMAEFTGIELLSNVCETTPNDEAKLYAAICIIHLYKMQLIPQDLTNTVDIVLDKVKRPGEWVVNCLGALRTIAGCKENHVHILSTPFFSYIPNLLKGSIPVVGHTFSVLYAFARFGEKEKVLPLIRQHLPAEKLEEFVNSGNETVQHNAAKLKTELGSTLA